MVMFTPGQSHSGGVIVKPYTEEIRKKTTPFLEWVAHGNPVKSQMQTDEDLVVEFLELSLATVILMHNDHILKVSMHCHRGELLVLARHELFGFHPVKCKGNCKDTSTVVFQEAYGRFPESQCRVPLLLVSLLDVMLVMQRLCGVTSWWQCLVSLMLVWILVRLLLHTWPCSECTGPCQQLPVNQHLLSSTAALHGCVI